ncbi:hypothetical protein V6N13_019714 [Hibiscus sabdariffa]
MMVKATGGGGLGEQWRFGDNGLLILGLMGFDGDSWVFYWFQWELFWVATWVNGRDGWLSKGEGAGDVASFSWKLKIVRRWWLWIDRKNSGARALMMS